MSLKNYAKDIDHNDVYRNLNPLRHFGSDLAVYSFTPPSFTMKAPGPLSTL